jgi:hypothetical protein
MKPNLALVVTSFPIDHIRQAIHPTGEQVTFLDDLATASSKASAILLSASPGVALRRALTPSHLRGPI